MPNKFNVLAAYKERVDNMLILSIRRNYRNYDGHFDYDIIKIKLGKTLSKTLINSLTLDELISIDGRIESYNDEVILISEQITRIRDV